MDEPTLVIFSGLPGTGKSTLANRLALELRWALIRIDDIAGDAPEDASFRFWDEKILVLLSIAEEQLKLGVSVIADSVFMGTDRIHAQEIVENHDAIFRPVFCFLSDEALWEKRVTKRAEQHDDIDVATWTQIQHQRQWFAPWESGTSLFSDAVDPVDQNYKKVLDFVSDQTFFRKPIKEEKQIVKGQYHE